MGFDTFTCLEYMNNVMKTPKNWAKDGILTEQILDALNSTKGIGLYLYDIRPGPRQISYGAGAGKSGNNGDEGRVRGHSDGQYEYYANQVYEMDLFVKELTDILKNYDEDVILVMYGDHLPALDMDRGRHEERLSLPDGVYHLEQLRHGKGR